MNFSVLSGECEKESITVEMGKKEFCGELKKINELTKYR
jgi:hypothetical protein